ncbi:MAG: redoxin domain-containing protein [Cytophagaceae bacterium]
MRKYNAPRLLLFLMLTSFTVLAGGGPKVGEKAPDFTITDPTGKSITLSSLQGKVILLDFWASWCLPCREANKELIHVYKKFNPEGFEIFSISLDSKKEPWMNAIKADKLTWPNHGSDLKGWDNKVAVAYNVGSIPATFLIDERGVIVAKDLDEADLEKKLHFIYFEQVNFYPKTSSAKIVFTGKTKYEIQDQKGSTILKGKGEEIDLSGIEAGEYTIKYEDKVDKFQKKINDLPAATFFPQRVDDKITASREVYFEIYNSRGKLVKSGKETIIDVETLSPGLYYLCMDGLINSFYKK